MQRSTPENDGRLPRLLGMVTVLAFVAIVFLSGTKTPDANDEQNRVVCYAALDSIFSEPILTLFKERTGIEVDWHFDTESTKSVGLAMQIKKEMNRPRCDVFWNNEIINTLRLKKAGALAVFRPKAAEQYPKKFRDPDGMWNGFAARCRVLLVNTDLIPAKDRPRRLIDLMFPRWKGKIGIAKPLFGTTATWVASLYANHQSQNDASVVALRPTTQHSVLQKILRMQNVRVLSGNKACAQTVATGDLFMAFTDTDDAVIEKENGKPVELIYLDGEPNGAGTLFIPNTLSLVKNAPHPENGRKLIEFLLSPEVETLLAKSASAQIPLNPNVTQKVRVKTPKEITAMEVNWDAATDLFDAAGRITEQAIQTPLNSEK